MFLFRNRSSSSPKTLRDCTNKEDRILWLASVEGQRVLQRRPKLQELYQDGKLQKMVNAQEWADKLDVWLSDGDGGNGLVRLLASGSEVGVARREHTAIPQLPAIPFTSEIKYNFLINGFCLLPESISSPVCRSAIKFINYRLGLQDSSLRPDLHNLASSISCEPVITDLLFSSPIIRSIEILLHGHAEFQIPALGAQIALRYPQLSDPPTSGLLGGNHWHIDGMDKGDHSPFTLLVGVALSDQLEPFVGNLCVWPGSHHIIQSTIRRLLAEDVPFGVRSLGTVGAGGGPLMNPVASMTLHELSLGEPVQLRMRVGDVVILHQKLAHRGAPNCGSEIRRMVYFRIHHKKHDETKQTLSENVWLEFEGMGDVL